MQSIGYKQNDHPAKKSIRIINNVKYNNHTEPLFKENKILKILDLYEMQVMKFMLEYKASILPKSFQNIYRW